MAASKGKVVTTTRAAALMAPLGASWRLALTKGGKLLDCLTVTAIEGYANAGFNN
jgi:hypothetical protein